MTWQDIQGSRTSCQLWGAHGLPGEVITAVIISHYRLENQNESQEAWCLCWDLFSFEWLALPCSEDLNLPILLAPPFFALITEGRLSLSLHNVARKTPRINGPYLFLSLAFLSALQLFCGPLGCICTFLFLGCDSSLPLFAKISQPLLLWSLGAEHRSILGDQHLLLLQHNAARVDLRVI